MLRDALHTLDLDCLTSTGATRGGYKPDTRGIDITLQSIEKNYVTLTWYGISWGPAVPVSIKLHL
jgi:hypothetical protein